MAARRAANALAEIAAVFFIYPSKAWPVYFAPKEQIYYEELLPPSLFTLLSAEHVPAPGCEPCPPSSSPPRGHIYRRSTEKSHYTGCYKPSCPTLQSGACVSSPPHLTALPISHTRPSGGPTAPSCPSEACSRWASAQQPCVRGLKSRGWEQGQYTKSSICSPK